MSFLTSWPPPPPTRPRRRPLCLHEIYIKTSAKEGAAERRRGQSRGASCHEGIRKREVEPNQRTNYHAFCSLSQLNLPSSSVHTVSASWHDISTTLSGRSPRIFVAVILCAASLSEAPPPTSGISSPSPPPPSPRQARARRRASPKQCTSIRLTDGMNMVNK